MKDMFYRYNPWWEQSDWVPRNAIPRPSVLDRLKASLDDNRVVFLTGLRRVGKTTLLKLFVAELIRIGTAKPSRIFFMSMDDYLLKGMSILDVVEEFRKIQSISHSEKVYLFLDEIASSADFEVQLKNLHDAQAAKVFASSSSASVLRDRKAFLTGRQQTIEVLPLCFSEFLAFRRISIPESDAHLLEKSFEEFLFTGGIPEYVLSGEQEYLKNLVDDIIRKDIAAHYKIRDARILKDCFLLLMERAGKQASINKVAKILGVSPDTARRYFDMFADSYLIYTLSRHGKTNERLLSPKKIYAPDLGVRTMFTGRRDLGSLFENYVFLRIRHLNPQYVYTNGSEIDFLTENGTLIVAKYGSSLSPAQEEIFTTYPAAKRVVVGSDAEIDRLYSFPSLR